jgi:hypothetical protein
MKLSQKAKKEIKAWMDCTGDKPEVELNYFSHSMKEAIKELAKARQALADDTSGKRDEYWGRQMNRVKFWKARVVTFGYLVGLAAWRTGRTSYLPDPIE